MKMNGRRINVLKTNIEHDVLGVSRDVHLSFCRDCERAAYLGNHQGNGDGTHVCKECVGGKFADEKEADRAAAVWEMKNGWNGE